MAVALPPPTLLAIWKRTGSSFSFSMAVSMARPSASLPPPGPVWTTTSTGLVGFHCAVAGDHAPAASKRPSDTPIKPNFIVSSGCTCRHPSSRGWQDASGGTLRPPAA